MFFKRFNNYLSIFNNTTTLKLNYFTKLNTCFCNFQIVSRETF